MQGPVAVTNITCIKALSLNQHTIWEQIYETAISLGSKLFVTEKLFVCFPGVTTHCV
jgi:hypothetical protein